MATLGHVRLHHSQRAEHHMGMPATNADWTVDMLDALPEDGQRYEIIDGVLHVTPGRRTHTRCRISFLRSRSSHPAIHCSIIR